MFILVYVYFLRQDKDRANIKTKFVLFAYVYFRIHQRFLSFPLLAQKMMWLESQ